MSSKLNYHWKYMQLKYFYNWCNVAIRCKARRLLQINEILITKRNWKGTGEKKRNHVIYEWRMHIPCGFWYQVTCAGYLLHRMLMYILITRSMIYLHAPIVFKTNIWHFLWHIDFWSYHFHLHNSDPHNDQYRQTYPAMKQFNNLRLFSCIHYSTKIRKRSRTCWRAFLSSCSSCESLSRLFSSCWTYAYSQHLRQKVSSRFELYLFTIHITQPKISG